VNSPDDGDAPNRLPPLPKKEEGSEQIRSEGERSEHFSPSIPTNAVAAEDATATSDLSRDKLEADLLASEAKLLRLAGKEAGQRHVIRWIAVSTGLVVIAGMFGVLYHTLHMISWWPWLRPPSTFMIVIVAGPVASITTITVALFIGAFRKFEEKDAESAANGVSTGIGWFRGS
jgi:hypothetical protein